MSHLLEVLAAKDEAEAIKNALKAQEQLSANERTITELTARVAQLETDKADLEAKRAASLKDALIAKLSEEGKAPPAMHDVLRTMSLEQIEALGATLPKVGGDPAQQPKTPKTPAKVVQLSDWGRSALAQMGLSEEDYAAAVKAEEEAS